MTRKSWRIKIAGLNCENHPAGTIVYSPKGYDYGLASDDSRITGIEHISVTLSPEGEYPTFTVQKCSLEEITE